MFQFRWNAVAHRQGLGQSAVLLSLRIRQFMNQSVQIRGVNIGKSLSSNRIMALRICDDGKNVWF
jgi:hypothetical protein